jgi:hypothetical protein
VVGVLVEVPVMLSLVAFANRTRGRFPASALSDQHSDTPNIDDALFPGIDRDRLFTATTRPTLRAS